MALISSDFLEAIDEDATYELIDWNEPSLTITDSIDLNGKWFARTNYKGIGREDTIRDGCYYEFELELLPEGKHKMRQNGNPIDSTLLENSWHLVYNSIIQLHEIRHEIDVCFYYQIRNHRKNTFTINRDLKPPYSRFNSVPHSISFRRAE